MLNQIFIIIIVDEDGPTDQGAEASDIPVLLQGNVYPLANDQIVLLGAPTTKALTDTAAFLKEQGKVDAVLADYAPSVNATFITQ